MLTSVTANVALSEDPQAGTEKAGSFHNSDARTRIEMQSSSFKPYSPALERGYQRDTISYTTQTAARKKIRMIY